MRHRKERKHVRSLLPFRILLHPVLPLSRPTSRVAQPLQSRIGDLTDREPGRAAPAFRSKCCAPGTVSSCLPAPCGRPGWPPQSHRRSRASDNKFGCSALDGGFVIVVHFGIKCRPMVRIQISVQCETPCAKPATARAKRAPELTAQGQISVPTEYSE
jgi:hypothetical protein